MNLNVDNHKKGEMPARWQNTNSSAKAEQKAIVWRLRIDIP